MESFKTGKEHLFGYGHHIYKVVDPRSFYIRQILDELYEEVSRDPVLKIAMEIDRLASTDPYFVSRKLHANADLLASFAHKAMFVSILASVMFYVYWLHCSGFSADSSSIMSCTQGILAHWHEAMGK